MGEGGRGPRRGARSLVEAASNVYMRARLRLGGASSTRVSFRPALYAVSVLGTFYRSVTVGVMGMPSSAPGRAVRVFIVTPQKVAQAEQKALPAPGAASGSEAAPAAAGGQVAGGPGSGSGAPGGPAAPPPAAAVNPEQQRAAMVDRLREDPYAAMLAARQALENDKRWARQQPSVKGTAFGTLAGGIGWYADVYTWRFPFRHLHVLMGRRLAMMSGVAGAARCVPGKTPY